MGWCHRACWEKRLFFSPRASSDALQFFARAIAADPHCAATRPRYHRGASTKASCAPPPPLLKLVSWFSHSRRHTKLHIIQSLTNISGEKHPSPPVSGRGHDARSTRSAIETMNDKENSAAFRDRPWRLVGSWRVPFSLGTMPRH
jgi:hypothetical protein